MPIFKVTATEEVTRKIVAYVEAPDERTAEDWASRAPDTAFTRVSEVYPPWCTIDNTESIDAAPAGYRVQIATQTPIIGDEMATHASETLQDLQLHHMTQELCDEIDDAFRLIREQAREIEQLRLEVRQYRKMAGFAEVS